jgi:hypothetical protein
MPDQFRTKRVYFSKAKVAREALKSQTLALVMLHLKGIKRALKEGKYQEAFAAIEWALEHAPADDGVTVIDASIDKTKALPAGPSGPLVQIGFQLGGIKPSQPLIGPAPQPAVALEGEVAETPADPGDPAGSPEQSDS